MKVLALVLAALAVVAWVVELLVAFVVLLVFWSLLRPFAQFERRHTPRTREVVDVLPSAPITKLLDDDGDDQDVVQEGLGTIHPLGDHVTPLEGLTQGERRLWDEVRRGIA